MPKPDYFKPYLTFHRNFIENECTKSTFSDAMLLICSDYQKIKGRIKLTKESVVIIRHFKKVPATSEDLNQNHVEK